MESAALASVQNFGPLPEFDARTDLVDKLPLATPISLFIDPSSLCNFRCKFCPTGDPFLIKKTGRKQQFLPLELFQKIIADVQEFPGKVKVLRLYKDGEPLLNPNFTEFVRLAKASGKFERIETTTNGSKLSPEMNARLIAAGIDRIVISIEGVTSEAYKSFAGFKLDFDSFVRNVEDLYKRRGACLVHVKTVQENLREGEEEIFIRTFSPISDRVHIEYTVPSWPNFDIPYVTQEEIQSRGAFGQKVSDKRVCAYPFYSMAINADGSVSPCCVDWDRSLVLGNLNEQSLKEVWNGSAMQALRRAMFEGRRKDNPTCATCGQISHCSLDNIDAAAARLAKLYS